MLDIAAGSAKKTNAQRKPRKCAEPHSALRCGQIGISAVAVAARYQSGARNQRHPQVVVELDQRGAGSPEKPQVFARANRGTDGFPVLFGPQGMIRNREHRFSEKIMLPKIYSGGK